MPHVYDRDCPNCGNPTVTDDYCRLCRWRALEDLNPTPVTTNPGPTDAPPCDPEPTPGDPAADPYPLVVDERGDADTDDTDLWDDLGSGG